MIKRAFVCDPVCALPYGHNVVGLKYFSEAVEPFFEKVVPIASLSLPESMAKSYGFEREFNFYYHQHIKLDGSEQMARLRQSCFGQDPVMELAARDTGRIFEKFNVSKNDSVIFPCVDYYGAMGLLATLRKIGLENSPTAYFRFIGVMENATSFGGSGLSSLSADISSAMKEGYRIKLCAETPAYADYLAETLKRAISVVPYPVHAEVGSFPVFSEEKEGAEARGGGVNQPFQVACPGSARFDKGYLHLLEIFSCVRRRDPEQRIKFVTQTLPIADSLAYSKYTNQLYATPGVRLLPSAVSEEEMNALYRQSDLVLLPYDPVTYAYRGSAVFMECISRGIPVVALAGSAFCKQIDYYGAGAVVSSVGEFVDMIFSYEEMARGTVGVRMMQARHRYSVDSDSAIADWVGK